VKPQAENMLEGGFVLVAAGLLAGLGVLVAGRVLGDIQRRGRHTEAPPDRGSIPPHRHQHLSPSPR